MVTDNSSKVLTVSYGTFSCTLEGFENSFDMMKTVAEYFRDLAAEDRFFGAEPPKLDAEILGILEQRGKQLGINTRQSGDTSIVLTPSQSYDEETSVEPSSPITEPTTPVSSPALSIDERLDRIKAATIADTVPAVYTEDEHANDVTAEHGTTADETSAAADMAAPSEETAELVDELPKIVDHIEFEDAPANIAPDEDVVAQPEVSAEDETQDIAGVEEIVDHPDTEPAPIATETVEEDVVELAEHPEAIDNFEEPEKNPAETSTEETLIASHQGDDVAETSAEEVEDQDPAHSEMVSEAEYDGEETAADTVFADDALEMDEFEAALTQDLMETDDEVESRVGPDVSVADDISDELDDTDVDEPEVAEDRVPLRLEQPVEEERIPLRKPRVHAINVSPGPSAEQTEEEETDTIMDDDDAPQPVAVRRPKRPVTKTRRETSEPVDTADVSRLMDETDQQMAKPESNRRRNALAHLRAAVAATIADKSLGKDDKDSTEAYRNDLAKAVRPRRPEPSGVRKSAPLRLVAEQRIDEPTAKAPEIAVPAPAPKPEVAVNDTNETQAEPVKSSDFADFGQFAAHVGAHSLEAKLEAAATYLSQIRGIDQFSRPQLLRTVKLSGTDDDFSREESLQHFAHMLRTGKLARKEDGLFEVTDEIGYQVMPKAG
jgi:hypothetical protein